MNKKVEIFNLSKKIVKQNEDVTNKNKLIIKQERI
jgi:hypothetical protein